MGSGSAEMSLLWISGGIKQHAVFDEYKVWKKSIYVKNGSIYLSGID